MRIKKFKYLRNPGISDTVDRTSTRMHLSPLSSGFLLASCAAVRWFQAYILLV